MAVRPVVLVIEPDGTTRHLVDKDSERFGSKIGPKLGTARASHVESWGDLSNEARTWLTAQGCSIAGVPGVDLNVFWADMMPVGGPVLGPFNRYEMAISAEIAWLHEHELPYAKRQPEPN